MSAADVQPMQLASLQPEAETGHHRTPADIGFLKDVDLRITVELGGTTRTIGEILGLGTGSVIELDKLAGEPVEILVNRTPIARGEVVVIDDAYGVRVTEIMAGVGMGDDGAGNGSRVEAG